MEVVYKKSDFCNSGRTEKHIGKYLKCLCPLHLIYYLLSPSPHLWTHREFPVTSWIRKKKLEETWAWCGDGSAWYVALPNRSQQYYCIPFWNIPTRQYTCIVVSELLTRTPWEAISLTRARCKCTIYFAFSIRDFIYFQNYCKLLKSAT